jgi:hypothetical protein
MLHSGHVETETTRHKGQEKGLCDRPRRLRQDQRGRGYPADASHGKAGGRRGAQRIVGRGISTGDHAFLSQGLSANGMYDAIADRITSRLASTTSRHYRGPPCNTHCIWGEVCAPKGFHTTLRTRASSSFLAGKCCNTLQCPGQVLALVSRNVLEANRGRTASAYNERRLRL